MTSNTVVPLNKLRVPQPLTHGNNSSLRDEVRRLVLHHIEREGYTMQQIAQATGYELWALESCFEQPQWDLMLGLQLADALGLRLRAIATN
jgi:hypothetical protein